MATTISESARERKLAARQKYIDSMNSSETNEEAAANELTASEEARADSQPVKKYTSEGGLSGRFKTGKEVGSDMALVGGQATLLNAMDQLAGLRGGLLEGISSLTPGGDSPMEGFLTGYDKAQYVSQEKIDLAGDRLYEASPALPVVSEVLGSLVPIGGPALLAKGAHGMIRHTGSFGSRMAAIGMQGLAGGVEGLLMAAFDGGGQDRETALLELGLPAAAGMVFGAGGQAILGEALPAALKYGLFNGLPATKVGSNLLDEGPTAASEILGINSASVRAAIPQMRDENKTLLEVFIGDKSPAVIINRFADVFAEAASAKNVPHVGGAKQTDIDDFMKTMGEIKRIGEETTARFNSTLTKTLGIPDSAYTRSISKDSRLAPLRKKFAKMSDTTVPGKNGAVLMPYKQATDQLNAFVKKKMKYGEADELGGAEKEYLSEVMDALRPRHRQPNTGKTVVSDSLSEKTPEGVNLQTANTTVADLIRARKLMSAKLKPGVMIDGTTQTKERAAAALSVRSGLDKIIARRIAKGNKSVNRDFRKIMATDDSYKAGQDFYGTEMDASAAYGDSLKDYLSALKKSSVEEHDAFVTGYKSAMMEAISRNGPGAELTSFLGEFDPRELDKVIHAKFGNINNLKAIIGDKETTEFIKDITEKRDMLIGLERMRQVAERKGVDPSAIQGMIRDGDSILLTGAFGPGQQALFANSSFAAIGRKVKSLGPREVPQANKLLTAKGEEGAGAVENWLTKYNRRSEVVAGQVAATPVISSVSEGVNRGEEYEGEVQDLRSERPQN